MAYRHVLVRQNMSTCPVNQKKIVSSCSNSSVMTFTAFVVVAYVVMT